MKTGSRMTYINLTEKLLTIYGAHCLKAINWLYFLLEYLQNSTEKLLKAVNKEQVIKLGTEEKDKNDIQRVHVRQIEEKHLYGQFWRVTKDVYGKIT